MDKAPIRGESFREEILTIQVPKISAKGLNPFCLYGKELDG